MISVKIDIPSEYAGHEAEAIARLVDDVVDVLAGHEVTERVPRWRRYGTNDHVACALTPRIIGVLTELERQWKYPLRPLCRAILNSRYPYCWVADNIAVAVADRLVGRVAKRKEKQREISQKGAE